MLFLDGEGPRARISTHNNVTSCVGHKTQPLVGIAASLTVDA